MVFIVHNVSLKFIWLNLDNKFIDWFVSVLGFYMRFEDDSVESAKIVKQWNVKIISVRFA